MVPEALELWVTQGMDPRSPRTSVQSTLQKAGRCRVQMSTVPSVLPLVRRQASLLEGSLEVKLPTIWTDGKEEVGRVTEEKRGEEKRKSQEKESGERVRRKSQEKESGERVRRKSQEKESGERVRRKSQKKESEERVRRKKAQAREKVEKSRNICVFRMICGSRGSKSRLAKAAGAEPSSQMRDDKLHAVVARSTFPSQNVQNTSRSDRFWQLRWQKKCTPLWREAYFQVKCTKHTMLGPLLDVEMSKKCTPLWREAHVEVKSVKN